jgi:hypothetical protein
VQTRSIQHAVVYGVLCVDCIIWVWRTRLAGRWRRSDHLLGSRRRETLWINIHHTTHTCLVAARGTVDTSLTVHWQRSQAQSAREPTNWPSVPAIQSAGRCEQGMCTRRGRRRRCGGSRNSLATGLIHAAARVRSSTLAYARITPAPLARVQSELADRSLFCMITSKLPFAASTPPREA